MDFEVNALGTVNLLEAARQHCRDAAFVFMSTNKVYGDSPNEKSFSETGRVTTTPIPRTMKGSTKPAASTAPCIRLFGASKAAADIYAQEYGRYFGMAVGIFRGGCLTGPPIPASSFTVSSPIC